MKKLLFFAVFLLVIAGVSFSCKKPEEKINYPIEMSFSDYSLEGTSCQWINLPYDEKVIVINSNEELNKYISCTEESFPAIDFSKQTLLLASGKANSNITALMTKSFQQTSVNNYELNIEITTNNTPDNELWSMAFKIEKIDKEIESINLHIIYQDVSAFYIVGYDVNCGVEILGETAKAKGVYVFISENLKDTVAAFLPDNLFSFPIDIMPCCNIFGFNFFPQEYRFAYKVKMTFVPMTNEELQEAFCVAPTNRPQIYFFEPLYVVISSISKINKS